MVPIKIDKYGPSSINAGDKFNVQPNGYSAIWIELSDRCEKDLIVQFDGYTLKSILNDKLLTALVPDSLTITPRTIDITIFYSRSPSCYTSLSFQILGSSAIEEYKKESDTIKKPNFFIIGAPRSGTTSMYWHLSLHPNIFMSAKKEPYYFDKRAHYFLQNAVTSFDSYLSLFQFAPFDSIVIGEASTTYLSSKEALSKINKFSPESKLLIMLRNPIDAAVSLFLRHREGGKYENADTFNTAWSLCIKGDRTFITNYHELFLIGNQLQNAIDLFGEDRLKVILFDNLAEDSISVYKHVLAFLNLKLDRTTQVKKSNSAKWINYRSIVNKDIYEEMAMFFFPQIEKVSAIIRYDLSHWLRAYEEL